MRESTIERYLRTEVKKLGGLCVKLMPIPAGVPDRLVMLPGLPARLVELKQPDGKVSNVQKVVHRNLANIGHPVAVLWSKPDIDDWLEALLRRDE